MIIKFFFDTQKYKWYSEKILMPINISKLDKNIPKTLQLIKITRPTLTKYIKIAECLDYSLLEYLDKKGKDKLKINDALYLCDNVLNPEQQYEVFLSFHKSPKKDKIRVLQESTTCPICMDTNPYFEYTPCCKTPICETCFSRTFETYIQDIIFKPVKCPYCNVALDLIYVKWYLRQRINHDKELWRNTKILKDKCHFNIPYQVNLYNKYLTMISRIESSQDYYIVDTEPDFDSLLGNEKYFGCCSQCLNNPEKMNQLFLKKLESFKYSDIPKECGNGEGGILVLEPEMFRYVVHKVEMKIWMMGNLKMSHCGIKTVKQMVVILSIVEIIVGVGFVMKE